MTKWLDLEAGQLLGSFGQGVTPGAGSAAALTGALACRLARASDRDGRFAELESLFVELTELVERDAAAFAHFWRLHSTNADPKTKSEALREATTTPLAITHACRRVAEVANELEKTGLPAARAEAVAARELASAAERSARFVVDENLRFARGAGWAATLAAKLSAPP